MRPSEERDVIAVEGVVVEVQRGDFHVVEVEIGGRRMRVLCRRAGRMSVGRVRLVAGDRVRVEVSPYDLGRGRIVWRD